MAMAGQEDRIRSKWVHPGRIGRIALYGTGETARGERYSGEGEYRSDGRVNPVNPLGVSLTHTEHTKDNTEAIHLDLEGEVNGLRKMVDLYSERLTNAGWRYQELMSNSRP